MTDDRQTDIMLYSRLDLMVK